MAVYGGECDTWYSNGTHSMSHAVAIVVVAVSGTGPLVNVGVAPLVGPIEV